MPGTNFQRTQGAGANAISRSLNGLVSSSNINVPRNPGDVLAMQGGKVVIGTRVDRKSAIVRTIQTRDANRELRARS